MTPTRAESVDMISVRTSGTAAVKSETPSTLSEQMCEPKRRRIDSSRSRLNSRNNQRWRRVLTAAENPDASSRGAAAACCDSTVVEENPNRKRTSGSEPYDAMPSNRRLPRRIRVAPSSIACTKSPLIPIDNSGSVNPRERDSG